VITAWRIVKVAFADQAFEGKGARQFGGRWNSAGTPIIYTADCLAAAALELMVNMIDYSVILQKFVRTSVGFPEGGVQTIHAADLPDGWQRSPASAECKAVGDAWVRGKESLVLKIPSAVIPEHVNYLINPEHPGFTELEINPTLPFNFDHRLNK
jgi:RES domain-containing protein